MGTFIPLTSPIAAYTEEPVQPLRGADPAPTPSSRPRYRVVLAGKSFFHIKEISTGLVRGFRCDHNQACHLAQRLDEALDGLDIRLRT